MPHIRLRGMTAEQVQHLSQNLATSLAPLAETSVDNFTIELVHTQFFANGQPISGYPFCEVFWFARSNEHRVRCAEWLTKEIKTLTQASDVAVVFSPIEKSDYFENETQF
jgi:hypothetical protein